MGIAKGAGMIEPDMATMLVYLVTDLQVRGVVFSPCELIECLLCRRILPQYHIHLLLLRSSFSGEVFPPELSRPACRYPQHE